MAGQTTNYLFDYPTSTDYVKDGATAIQELADDVDATLFTALGGAYPGLRLIKKQTVGTGVSSVTLTSCFSSAYENYRVLYSGGLASSTGNSLFVRGSSGTGSNIAYAGDFIELNGSRAGLGSASTANFVASLTGTQQLSVTIDITQPFLAAMTGLIAHSMALGAGVGYATRTAGFDTQTLSSTGLTVAASSGTITGGTIYVYGYGAS
jgi:hypothetical protein